MMENLMTRLEEWLAGMLGGAAIAETLSKVLLISLAALIFVFLWMLLSRTFAHMRLKVGNSLGTTIKGVSIQRQRIFTAHDVSKILQGTIKWIEWVLKVALLLAFLNLVFFFFDWSRQLAVKVLGAVLGTLEYIVVRVVEYLPSLAVIVIVLLLARFLIHLLKIVFNGIGSKRITLPGFYPEWAHTSYSLVRVLVIILTLIIIFPYLPGSNSPAFQGVSIFVGVLLSLGSTTAVANVVAGIVITYTRAFKIGDRVQISGTDGTVVERSAFVTRVRTQKNVEVSIPNSGVLSNPVINYSSQSREAGGLTLHTSITIGYDVPWPTVHELLLEAASKTKHVESEPSPYVLQTALSDFYVEYELNVTTRDASLMPFTYSDLHANILSAFQAAGVEILSPHYEAGRDGSNPAIPQGSPKWSAEQALVEMGLKPDDKPART